MVEHKIATSIKIKIKIRLLLNYHIDLYKEQYLHRSLQTYISFIVSHLDRIEKVNV